MFKFILAAASACLSFGANCQDSCSARLLSFENERPAAPVKYTLRLSSASGGELYYFGARHLTQPADPQFDAIKESWKQFHPTIVFFEGPDRGVAISDTLTILKMGESGFVRFLAKEAGIRAFTLEPPPSELFRYLVSKQSQQKVELYFLLAEAMRLRTRQQYSKVQIEQALTGMIRKMQNLTDDKLTITSIAELERSFKIYWNNASEWWEAPKEWFDPAKSVTETGGVFTNDLNKLSSAFRDIYIYRLLAENTNKGERVFAVIGRDHVVSQHEALKCAIR